MLILLACSDTDRGVLAVAASVHPDMASIGVLEWEQPASGTVRADYRVGEEEWLTTPSYDLEAGPQRLLLLGAPFASTMTWRLVGDGFEAEGFLETGDLPAGVPEADTVEGDAGRWDADTRWVLLSFAPQGGESLAWTLIIDRAGRVVWAKGTEAGRTTYAPRPSADGTALLVDHNSWWGSFDGGVNSEVVRLDIEGAELERVATPGLIHPYTELEDGTLTWSAAQGGTEYAGDALVRRRGDTIETMFDCNAFSEARGGGMCGANAITWDPLTERYLYSLYSLDTVIELTPDGEPVRWFGHLDGAWGFADPDTAFWWQHGAHYLPDGHLLLSARRGEEDEETVVREYRLEAANEELVEVWSFGEGEGVYAPVLGEARRLPGGDTLHNYGGVRRIREATPDGEVVWDVAWDDSLILGSTWPLSDLYAFAR